MKSTARYIGQIEDDGSLPEENVIFGVDAAQMVVDERDIRYDAPMRIGARQLSFTRWTASLLYKLSLPAGEVVRPPVAVTLRRGAPDDDVGFDEMDLLQTAEAMKEEIQIVQAYDAESRSLSKIMQISFDTIGANEGYRLDTGILGIERRTPHRWKPTASPPPSSRPPPPPPGRRLGRRRTDPPQAGAGPHAHRPRPARSGVEARRLERTFNNPTCVGVFGPSQAGKSHLISVLARKEDEETMIATFDGPERGIDFITRINPFGGKEATGLVTRFSMQAEPTPPGFPVCLRLLSPADIVKIIVNSHPQDGDQEYEAAIEAQAFETYLKTFVSPRPAGANR